MDHFPSRHGARVVFDPIVSTAPAPASSPPIPRAAAVPRDAAPASSTLARPPSYAEIDVVEADLQGDPRYDRE